MHLKKNYKPGIYLYTITSTTGEIKHGKIIKL